MDNFFSRYQNNEKLLATYLYTMSDENRSNAIGNKIQVSSHWWNERQLCAFILKSIYILLKCARLKSNQRKSMFVSTFNFEISKYFKSFTKNNSKAAKTSPAYPPCFSTVNHCNFAELPSLPFTRTTGSARARPKNSSLP